MDRIQSELISLLIHSFILLTCFPIHESAHALAAHWMGDDTAKNQGRISLNPFVHLDIWGAVAMVVMGFGWAKPVPINPNNFKKPKWGMALSALAGPVSNLLLAYVFMIFYKVAYYLDVKYAAFILIQAMLMNLGLAVFNLLPVPPLDGSRLLTVFLPTKTYFRIMEHENILMVILIVLSLTGILGVPLYYLENLAINIMDSLSGWVDLIMTAVK